MDNYIYNSILTESTPAKDILQQHASIIELVIVVILIGYCITMLLYKLKNKKKSWILYATLGVIVFPSFHPLLQIVTTLLKWGNASFFIQLTSFIGLCSLSAFIYVKFKEVEEWLDRK